MYDPLLQNVFGVTEGMKKCRCDARSIPFMCSFSGYSKDYNIHPNPLFTSSEDSGCKREVDLFPLESGSCVLMLDFLCMFLM